MPQIHMDQIVVDDINKTEQNAELYLYQMTQKYKTDELRIRLEKNLPFWNTPGKRFIYVLSVKRGDKNVEVRFTEEEHGPMAYTLAIKDLAKKVAAQAIVEG